MSSQGDHPMASEIPFVAPSRPAKSERETRLPDLVDATPEERFNFVPRIVIPIPGYVAAMELLEALYASTGVLVDPGGVSIFGESGMGKTVLCAMMLKAHPPSADGSQRPVLHLEMEQKVTVYSFLAGTLKRVGYPFASHKTAFDLVDVLADAIRSLRVRLILIDEGQEAGEGRGTERPKEIANEMKRLYDKTKIAQAYLGTPDRLERFFKLGDQLETRISAKHRLLALNDDEIFLGLLKGFDAALPMREVAGLCSPDFAKPIYRASGGNLRRLRNLLAFAVLYAASENAPKLTLSHLSKAHFRVNGTGANPFR